ncbi:hypothetical protein QTG54_016541 [Skeletonema marinoi]|uniref:SAP domain-containing protein n=1 Tax=Skeletonema marinoi TaxID=267567 RepID=A0AAD8XSL9_9STRA|nr:hypothetical protein QTG54_016541 [Skeletonema marinoi]
MTNQNNKNNGNNVDVDNLKWNELRKTVKQYGLSTSGKKIDLQQRLKNHLQAAAAEKGVTKEVATQDDEEVAEQRHETTTAEKETKVVNGTTPPTIVLSSEQQRRMEENRKRALEIRQLKEQKRLKSSSETAAGSNSIAANPITPAAAVKRNPYKNPYAKAASTTTTSTPAAVKPFPSSSMAAAVTVSASKNIAPKKPPPVISAWGDCRLDLWEAACRCGGAAEHSPDVRMCRCGAALDTGLDCQGCGGGVLLIKSGPRGNFWGCSNYKKRGCKFTKRFGSPHDAKAAGVLAQMKQSAARKMDREREERSRIKDQFEKEWRSLCRCGGAKNLNTFECKMQSEGGCGMLPLCPEGCGGRLFLHPSKYGGKWWGCSNFRNGLCKFRANYDDHA